MIGYDKWKLQTPPTYESEVIIRDCYYCCEPFDWDDMKKVFIPKKKYPNGIFFKGGNIWCCLDCYDKNHKK